MNSRSKLIIVIVAVVLLAIGVAWWLKSKPLPATSPLANAEPTPESRVKTDKKLSPTTTPGSVSRQIAGGKFSGLSALSAAAIEFYGKVIDQDSKPLPGVAVIGRTGSKTGFMQEEHRSYETTTDASGGFAFKGFKGDGLVIELKKAGYNFDSDRRQFLYSPIDPDNRRFTPDRSSPVVFQMWKSLGAEPLIHYQESLGRAPNDGSPTRIDLIKGKFVKEGGDLIVTVKRGASAEGSPHLFDWSVKLNVPDGGIMEGGSNVMFLAPEEGYQESLEYRFAASERQAELHRTFYVVSRAEKTYSRVELWLENQIEDTRVTARVWLNPKPGSRNLEYDPAKQASAR